MKREATWTNKWKGKDVDQHLKGGGVEATSRVCTQG